MPQAGWTDERLDQWLGMLLRTGVVLAAAIVAVGGLFYLYRYASNPEPNYAVFQPDADVEFDDLDGVPMALRSLSGIFASALSLHSRGLIQLGIIVLVATPIARVIFSVFAFALQRDYTYVVVTLIVLAVLLYSLLTGGHT